MDLFNLTSLIICFAVAIGYLNQRFFRAPASIAIMAGALLLSLALIVLGQIGYSGLERQAIELVKRIDFYQLLMQGMLSFLLFAGALTIDIQSLKAQKWEIGILSTLSTLASTILVALLSYGVLHLFDFAIPFIYCLLFGALISPTDPIAVLGLCKQIQAPKPLEMRIAGESLFNDGVGIVLFLTFYQLATAGGGVDFSEALWLFLREAVGGILFGLVLGWLAYGLLKTSHEMNLMVLITLAIVTGGYSLAQFLEVSGPLAMVVAGILIGNRGFTMAAESYRQGLRTFWEIIDEVLNAVLFLLIGLEILALNLDWRTFSVSLLMIPLVLLVRFVSVGIPLGLFRVKRDYAPHTIKILTWGGLRGGLAVALALSLPVSDLRELILTMTYAVVVFSILVQGLTVKSLVVRSKASMANAEADR